MKERKARFYQKEIDTAMKDDYIACTLAQLKKRNEYTHKALFNKVNSCMPKNISERAFEVRLKKMTELGLAYETFSKSGFAITSSPVGNTVESFIRNSNSHLRVEH